MSNYTPITDFAAKDDLAGGDPEKAILGADITEELEAISSAIATKAEASDLAAVEADVADLIASPTGLEEGSFSYTLGGTQFTTSASGTMYYRIIGDVCTLYVTSKLEATAGASAGVGTFNTSSIPAACRPSDPRLLATIVSRDSEDKHVLAQATVTAAGVVSLSMLVNGKAGTNLVSSDESSPDAWTTSTSWGLPAGWTITYPL